MHPPSATGRPKLIYFAERLPGFDRDGFIERWRRHARLGMSMPRWKNIHRYVHCDAVETPEFGLPVAWCDGVAMVWYRSEEARLNHLSDRSAGPIMRRDERETFARPVREVSVLTDEHVFQAPEPSPLKLFLRVRGHPELPRRTFRNWWLREFGPLLLRRLGDSGQCQGYHQNHARALSAEDGAPPLCDCVDEVACTDAGRCGAVFRAALAEAADVKDHVSTITAICTAETVLYSR